uniref:Uncharacterized protein n=1 Tax=Anopheles minimus TaxID=112268 RepID=A0A182WNQ7_9DIPT
MKQFVQRSPFDLQILRTEPFALPERQPNKYGRSCTVRNKGHGSTG